MPTPSNIPPISETEPLQVVHTNPERFKHFDGMSEDEIQLIRLMADIFVKSVLKLEK